MTSLSPAPEDIAGVIGGLLDALLADDRKQVQALQSHSCLTQARHALEQLDPQAFRLSWGYPAERLARAIVQEHVGQRPRAAFLFLEHDFVHAHLREVFSHFEGAACCADKARWAAKAVLRHELRGEPIVLGHPGSERFWEPQKVLRDQEELLAFIDALSALRHGRAQPFFARWARLLEIGARSGDPA